MRRRSTISTTCLVAILIGQSLFAYDFAAPSYATDLDSMLQQGLKNQIQGAANQFQNNSNSVTAPISGISGPTQQAPIKVDRKSQRLEDLIARQDIPYSFPPMIPLQGITIAGLGPKSISSLGENYFVVRSNTNTTRMSDLYKENKAAGKANFVTMDCIVHPYLGFVNRVHAETIRKYLAPMTKSLLLAMLKVAEGDYKQADDVEVRADIECNIAFLSLAMKLLDSSYTIPAIGRVPQLVQADYDSVVFAKPGRSAIFDRNEDFSYYRPLGWYRTSPELFTFYRAKTWLSRMYYPINDVTYDSAGTKANNFRRSVLLYRCLDLARIDGKPAMDQWMHLVKGMFLLGAQVESWQEKNLYAHDYKSVFKANSIDLKMTLTALSEPLYRTKLLLAVRKQKPLTLNSTSIFDLEEAKTEKDVVAAFKFIPAIGSPEEPWLRYAATLYPKPQLSTNVFPVALLDLNAWGAPQAGNCLLDASWAIDESMPKTVSELKRWVLRRAQAGQVQPVDCRIWSILSPAWRLLPDGIQTAMRGQMWSVRRLETVYSAWVDNLVSIAPEHYAWTKPASTSDEPDLNQASQSADDGLGQAIANAPKNNPQKVQSGENTTAGKPNTTVTTDKLAAGSKVAAGSSSNQSSIDKLNSRLHNEKTKLATNTNTAGSSPPHSGSVTATATSTSQSAASSGGTSSTTAAGAEKKEAKPTVARRAARGHFLDPCPDFYNRLQIDTQRLDKELTELGFPLDTNFKRGLDDYSRLFQRFFKIAKDEVDGRPLNSDDLSLLGNIDMILDKIDLPLPAVVNIEPPASFSDKAPKAPGGFSMALGRPGLIYMILMNKTTREWTLARGAVYTYYEQFGTSLNEETLLTKIDKGTIQPPYWAEHYDFLQAEKK